MSSPADLPDKISALERYQVYRSRIEHEDNLVVQRLSWLMASQSFLFTAYAIATSGMSSLPANAANIFVNRLVILSRIVPIVAALNSVLILLSIVAALKAIRELRRCYLEQPDTLHLIPLQTSKYIRALGLSAPVLLPLLFLAVWLFLLTQ